MPHRHFTKWFGQCWWSFPRFIISLGVAKQWSLSSFILSACIGWNSFIKQTFFLSTIWLTWITVCQERQDKCVFLSLYQPVFWMSLCPHILQKWSKRISGFTFSYHYALTDFNIFDVSINFSHNFIFILSNWLFNLFNMTPVVFDRFLAFWFIPGSCTFPAPVLEIDVFLRSLISCCGEWVCPLLKLIVSRRRDSRPEYSEHSQDTDEVWRTGSQHLKFYFIEQNLPSYNRIHQVKCIQYNLYHLLTHYWLLQAYEWMTSHTRLHCTHASHISRGLGRSTFCRTWSLNNWEGPLFGKMNMKLQIQN